MGDDEQLNEIVQNLKAEEHQQTVSTLYEDVYNLVSMDWKLSVSCFIPQLMWFMNYVLEWSIVAHTCNSSQERELEKKL